ncbi:MAG: helix-turn-helix transcriptional regulator [Trueperaceae bacterium]|nr:helix-turn-helix transcriptional regulator [Trueperaceae bacterium]
MSENQTKYPITGTSLRQTRLELRLTQEELAEMADLQQSHLSEMERGKRTIGPTVRRRLEDALAEARSGFMEYRESIRRAVAQALQEPRLQARSDALLAKTKAQNIEEMAD